MDRGHPELNRGVGGPAPLAFFFIYLVVGCAFFLVMKGGVYTVLAPLGITFGLVPVLDALFGVNDADPPESPRGGAALAMFRLATWLAVPMQAGILLWGAHTAARPSVPVVELVGALFCVGISGGVIGITVAHELIHRHGRIDRLLGGVLLTMVSYLHWSVEHVAGHHSRVATPDDPATARLGESLPAFLVRSIAQSLQSAWLIEASRLARHGVRSVLQNRVLWFVLSPFALAGALGLWLGPRAAMFFFAQSLVAIALLEIINYIEHYGLVRRHVRPGVYERVTPAHSWNSTHRLTNALLFNLQRHADHHVWPRRPYHMLRHHPESPQLPMGYAGMALLAMVPPLWRRIMDPRVQAHRARLGTPG